MMIPNSNHGEAKMEGLRFGGGGGGKASCDYFVESPDQSLQLVPHPIAFDSSTSANANMVRVLSVIDDGSRVGRKCSSNPKASKKKNNNGYHHCQGVKKQRLIWTQELHECFLEIYNCIPHTKLFPKKILEQMRVKFPFVTRENVASHLQKHRLNLKKITKENSEKSSSKSVPLKIPKESNSLSIHPNTSNSNSTNPNSQLILQSHPNSTLNPNSQILLQRHPNYSTFINPNSHASQPKKPPHIGKPETLLNHEVHFNFDETNYNVSNQRVMNQQLSFNNNVNGGGSNIYSNLINNVSESQENFNWRLPRGQSSINAATNDVAISINLYPPPISANQISNLDNDHGNGFHPLMDFNSFGGLNNTHYDAFLPTLPNYGFGDYYNMNLNFDNHLQVGHHDALNHNNSEALDFGYPPNLNTINDFQMNEQGLQSILSPPITHMENDSTFQHCFGRLQQTFVNNVNPENQWVEQQSMNEYFSPKGPL